MELLRELEVEKYWSFPATYSKDRRNAEIQRMMMTGKYYYQQKYDGNYSAFICDFDGDKRLLTRGISKVTAEYGRIEDKVFFFDAIANAFNKPTRIMAEVCVRGGIDRNVGSILRCGADKAKSIQDNEYYLAAQQRIKFTAKDRRDIEGNEFRGHKLQWRIFDVWYYDGEDLMDTPWIERQKYVKLAAERIGNPLVTYIPYHPMDDTFYERLAKIFAAGGEGVVCYDQSGKPEPGKRTAHKTLKVKQEIENLIDCFIIGITPSTKDYTGKDPEHWQFWEDARTNELLYGEYYNDWKLGRTIRPVTKGYYAGVPGAIEVGVYDNDGKIMPLCKVSGLEDSFRYELKENYEKWHMCPVTVGGMMISVANGISIRHPYLKAIRAQDIDPKDCTLKKILE